MSKKKKRDDKAKDDFDLYAPSGEISSEQSSASKQLEGSLPRPKAKSDESLKQFAWRGFEEDIDEVDADPDVNFTKGYEEEEDGMDMTPMVDVTFLLLIFFMVTASFSLQRSIPQPPSKINEPSTQVAEEPETEKDYVEVIIDQQDRFFITTRFEDEEETPSETQMRAKIRNAKVDYGAERLIITAHVDSTHQQVIKVWDAGIASDFSKIEMKTTEVEY